MSDVLTKRCPFISHGCFIVFEGGNTYLAVLKRVESNPGKPNVYAMASLDISQPLS